MALPEILDSFGVDLADVLDAARLPASIFDDRENLVTYQDLGRLLAVSARLTYCDYIALLVAQRARLAAMGLAGDAANCGENVGDGLQKFVSHFTLQNTAATISLVTSGGYTRFVYAIAAPDMTDTGQLQLGAMTIAFNILRDLCGHGWRPVVVTFACRAPANLRPCQRYFRAPLRFDSDESAIVFESRWLDRSLPPVDPLARERIEAEVRKRQAALFDDFPATMRRLLRKQLILGECSIHSVAAIFGVHRRTLDRMLERHGVHFSKLLESVQSDVACQLLRDTEMPMQQIAESLRYSSAANFATAFRRWTGVTPTKYRRSAGRPAG
jgi:AraC-like DNA-binding protein